MVVRILLVGLLLFSSSFQELYGHIISTGTSSDTLNSVIALRGIVRTNNDNRYLSSCSIVANVNGDIIAKTSSNRLGEFCIEIDTSLIQIKSIVLRINKSPLGSDTIQISRNGHLFYGSKFNVDIYRITSPYEEWKKRYDKGKPKYENYLKRREECLELAGTDSSLIIKCYDTLRLWDPGVRPSTYKLDESNSCN